MKTRLTNAQLFSIVEGSTILGTGGGGRLDSALSSLKDIRAIELVSCEELRPDDIVITAYGAGGLTKPKSTKQVIEAGLALLQKSLNRRIAALVPVEIGPYSLAVTFEIASILDIPVVDGDLVGFRSVPEIFIELVTLADLSRCPLVFGNNEGDLLLLESSETPESLEEVIRSFAEKSKSNTFVLGYPYTRTVLETCLAKNSVSYCIDVNARLQTDFRTLGQGKIIKDYKQEKDGFTQGYLVIEDAADTYRIMFKNEYLALTKNGKVIVTCPDLICVIDISTGRGLNNGDENMGKNVQIYARPSIEQWRTPKGRALFSPKALGLPYKQKLLEEQP